MIKELFENARLEGRDFLLEPEAKIACMEYGIPVTRLKVATNAKEALEFAAEIGYPVVLKIVSPDIVHKVDAGGVVLDLRSPEQVEKGFEEIIESIRRNNLQAEILGVAVQEMVPSSTEVIVGAIRDQQFGPTLMFGLGGTLVEVLEDVSFRIAPITKQEAEEMIAETKASTIFGGYRGLPSADTEAVVKILLSTSQLIVDCPVIKEIDLNPVIVHENGAKVVDARIILDSDTPAANSTSWPTESRHCEEDRTCVKDFFEPSAVAVVGASRETGKIGNTILVNIVDSGYKGKIYPINRKAHKILGLKAYPSVLDVPSPLDLVVLVVPSKFAPEIVEQCARKEVKAVVIISGGFGEIGEQGAELEETVLKIARKAGVRIIGPNCQGVNNPHTGLVATFGGFSRRPGPIAIVSQSGTVGAAIQCWADREGIGISKCVNLGNKIDVTEADLIQYLKDDADTKVIATYVEGVSNGRAFMKAVSEASKAKPVVVLKGGTTKAGVKAALSHTSSLAGNPQVFEAALRQAKGVKARSLEELYDFSKAFSHLQLPKGPGVLIIESTGGAGILAADMCERLGLRLPKLDVSATNNLRKTLPSYCTFGNPFDLTASALSPDRFRLVIEENMSNSNIHSFITIFGDPIQNAAEEMKKASAETTKPILVSYLGGGETEVIETVKMQSIGIPVFPSPERAVSALSALVKYSETLKGA